MWRGSMAGNVSGSGSSDQPFIAAGTEEEGVALTAVHVNTTGDGDGDRTPHVRDDRQVTSASDAPSSEGAAVFASTPHEE